MAFKKFVSLSLLSILMVVSLFTTSIDACSCMPTHPQTDYCDANYVILARILKRSLVDDFKRSDVMYKIKILKSYKMTDEGQFALQNYRLISAAHDSLCGVNLIPDKLYVIAGKKARISLCDYVKEYKDISVVERHGFAGAYKRACECKVQTCFNPQGCDESINSCNWKPFSKCETTLSACVVGKDPTEGCHWKRNKFYKNCLRMQSKPILRGQQLK